MRFKFAEIDVLYRLDSVPVTIGSISVAANVVIFGSNPVTGGPIWLTQIFENQAMEIAT